MTATESQQRHADAATTTARGDDVVAVAVFTAASGRTLDLEAALRTAVKAVHEEVGCRRYALHRVTRGEGDFVIIEH